MSHEPLRQRPWYPNAVAACIAVTLFVALTHLDVVLGTVNRFFGFFSAVILGCVLAYLINPLASLLRRKLFGGLRRPALGWKLAVVLAVAAVLLLVALLLGLMIPQLVTSVAMLAGNLNGYLESLEELSAKWGLSELLNLTATGALSEKLITTVVDYASQNLNQIANVSALAGRSVMNWAVAVILSVYLLMAKDSLRAGVSRLMRALLRKRYRSTVSFLTRCDSILIRYIVFSLLDSAIVGMANAAFMLAFRMQYLGLVSVVVGVTNLIPTFGPVIGMIVGGVVLLLVKPWHALAFLIFSLVLQFLDGYVIKPKLFGNSLGVSGLLILIAVIVGGNMFGVVGILLAIPSAAILDFVYRDYLLPGLEHRK